MPHIGNFPERGHPRPLAIPPAIFVPEEDVFDYRCYTSGLRNGTTLTLQTFFGPVFLPHRATVTKLTLLGYRTTGGSTLRLELLKAPPGLGPTCMVWVAADWTDGYGSKSSTMIMEAVIDNENYCYGLMLEIDPDAVVTDCIFTAAIIEWS